MKRPPQPTHFQRLWLKRIAPLSFFIRKVLLRFELVLLCSALAVLAGCGESRQTNVEYGNQHKVLHIANGDDPASLDPQLATGLSERNIFFALFEGLVSTHPATMEAVPGVAEHWEISDDRLTYIFHLRENARWSNGEPLTADDFVYGWQRILSPATGASFAYMLYYIQNAQAYHKGELEDFAEIGVKALDTHRLQVKLSQPTPFFYNCSIILPIIRSIAPRSKNSPKATPFFPPGPGRPIWSATVRSS